MNPTMTLARAALAAGLSTLFSLAIPVAARADGGRLMPADMPPAYLQECGACHTAYPPGLLPAAAWRRIMAGLDKHYGSDAALDPAQTKQIGAWLQARAGTTERASEQPPQDRITRSAWFERKHRRVESATWALPSVKSAANCAACHPGAERGDFDDDRLVTPPGLSPAQRRTWRD